MSLTAPVVLTEVQSQSWHVSPQRAIAGFVVLLFGLYLLYIRLMSGSQLTRGTRPSSGGYNGARVADIPGKGKGVIATRDIAVRFHPKMQRRIY